MHFNPYAYFIRPFSRGGGHLPSLYIDLEPPAFTGLSSHENKIINFFIWFYLYIKGGHKSYYSPENLNSVQT